MSIEILTFVHFRHFIPQGFSSLFTNLPAYKALYLRAYKVPVFYLCRKASCGLSSVFCLLKSEIQSTKHFVRNYQRNMQNKPNFPDPQINVSTYLQTAYENNSNWTLGQNKPNSNPIKPNCRKAQMNVNLSFTKDYRKKDDFVVRKNKPNFVKGLKWT